jgi:hypothetical protein
MTAIEGDVQTVESNEGRDRKLIEKKELELAQEDNINPKVTPCKYLDKYVFSDLHEIFFCDFPHVLQEWILRLKDNHTTNHIRKIEWNLVDIGISYHYHTSIKILLYNKGVMTMASNN